MMVKHMGGPTRASLVAATTLAVAPAPAFAGPIINHAARALKNDPVYVDPAAPNKLSPPQVTALRNTIAARDPGRILIAVLPQSAAREVPGGTPEAVGLALERSVRKRATYGLIVGSHFRAGSTVLAPGVAG